MNVFIGVMIPFIGTTLGAMMVFLLKKNINPNLEKILLGFASGVMIAASIWSLIMPSVELSKEKYTIFWMPVCVGFLLGILFLVLIDCFFPTTNNIKNKNLKMVLAVTIHNIPEGMAVGVIFAGMLSNNSILTLAGAFSLSIGIAIQNIPEGAIISMPLKNIGYTKFRSFVYGTLSGIVEPIFAVITLVLTGIMSPILPYLLSFAAGAMFYVVVVELIPESINNDENNLTIFGLSIGFLMMLIFDLSF